MNIAILLSGGVDSSVALHLLQEQGHTITAFYLKIWLEDELSFLGTCPWEEDLAYVQAVCQQRNVPLRILSFQNQYREKIISYTIAEIKAGRTPNPDVLCNLHIKFGAFYDAIGDEFDAIATGHYALRTEQNGIVSLCKAPDKIKDQTYFLSQLHQNQLKKALFPLGNLCKEEVRSIAHKINLPNKARKDSQGVCFLGKLKFSDFIKYHAGEQLGDLIESDTGRKIGEHKGFWFYTIGQRHSIGLSGGPWYVVAKDTSKNHVFVSRNYYAPNKERKTFIIDSCNWTQGKPESDFTGVTVKMRHGPAEAPCLIETLSDGGLAVTLEKDDQGIAPGQFAVLYKGDVCLGGGPIREESLRLD
jgi:tRNA (5-methylaminomethyl-2-thiouridylate)-methyltransferase